MTTNGRKFSCATAILGGTPNINNNGASIKPAPPPARLESNLAKNPITKTISKVIISIGDRINYYFIRLLARE